MTTMTTTPIHFYDVKVAYWPWNDSANTQTYTCQYIAVTVAYRIVMQEGWTNRPEIVDMTFPSSVSAQEAETLRAGAKDAFFYEWTRGWIDGN